MKKTTVLTLTITVDEKERRAIAKYTGSDPDFITLGDASDEFKGTILSAITEAAKEIGVGKVTIRQDYQWLEESLCPKI